MSQVISLRCQHCGASLQVGDTIRFVTCNYCHSELEVIKDDSTIYTQVLGKIEAATGAMAGSLKVIETQNEVERLDREWEAYKATTVAYRRDGRVTDLRRDAGFAMVLCFVIGFCVALRAVTLLVAMIGELKHGKSAFDVFLPIIVCSALGLLLIVIGSKCQASRKEYTDKFDRYQAERAVLMQQLEAMKGRG